MSTGSPRNEKAALGRLLVCLFGSGGIQRLCTISEKLSSFFPRFKQKKFPVSAWDHRFAGGLPLPALPGDGRDADQLGGFPRGKPCFLAGSADGLGVWLISNQCHRSLLHAASVAEDDAETAILVHFAQGIQLVAFADQVGVLDGDNEFADKCALDVGAVSF